MKSKEPTEILQLQSKKIKDPPMIHNSQEIPQQALMDRKQFVQTFKVQCLIKAHQAFATPHPHRNFTNKAFKNLFGFQKRETKTFKNDESPKKYESYFVKNFERKVLRHFIGISNLGLKDKRTVTMSFRVFFKSLIQPIPIEVLQETFNKMKDIGQFIGPYFEKELTENKDTIEAFTKKMIVEFYFFYKLRDLLKGVCEDNLDETLKLITIEQRKDEKPLEYIEHFWEGPGDSNFDDQLRYNSSPSEDQHSFKNKSQIEQIVSPNIFLEESVYLVNPEIRDSSSISFSIEIFEN